jgi:autotransporter-associated beta strand protein
MKSTTHRPSTRARARRILASTVRPAALVAFALQAHAGNTWDGGGGDNNWGTGANWNPDGAPGYGTISFAGTTQTTNNNNSITAMNQVNWNGTAAWVMNGTTTLSLFDFGGTQAKLESLGSGGVTINANITFAANNGGPPNPFGEINAVSSNMSFTGGTLTVNGSSVNGIKMFGGNGRDVSFSNTVSAVGKWFGFTSTNSQSATIATGANVTSNDWYVMNGGTLNLAGGTLTTTAVRLGGDFGNTGNQNQTLGGTLALTPAAGGITFGSTINAVSGNTSNALRIDSQNTSGTNTLTSGIFLDSDLRISQATGGALTTSLGTFDIKARKLTVDGGGSVTVSQNLTSSLGAGGFLVKSGSGTLTLSSTSNTYTGTNNTLLNANGTQINAGTLAIAGDTSLGLAPAGAYNNVQFTGTSALQSNANISLHANRNVSIASGTTATLASQGNTFTVNGVINGSGALTTTGSGSGSVVLKGNNTFTGATTVSSGTLDAGAAGALGATSGVAVNSGGTLLLSGTGDRIGNTVPIDLAGGTFNTAGLSETVGVLTLSVSSTLDLATGASVINFGNSSGAAWGGGTLAIENWSGLAAGGGTDQVFFGTSASGLTSGQLSQISFINPAGFAAGTYPAGILSNGEIVPIPEPSTVLVGVALAGLAFLRERRKADTQRRVQRLAFA